MSGRRMGALLASLVIAGLALPLFGASLLVIGAADLLVRRFWPLTPQPASGEPS